jgi:HSP20 family protein
MLHVTRFAPLSPMFQLRRDIDDIFGRVFGQMSGDSQGASGNWSAWTPAVEGSEDERHYVIRIALPGVDPKDVDVTMADNQLTIKGQRKRDAEIKQENYFARELAYGTFERSFTLPEGVDVTKISARYSNGMLEVTVPKPVAEAPRKVAIEVEGASQKALS